LAHNPAEFGEDRKPSDISPLIVANCLKQAMIWVKLAMIWILRKFADSGKKHFRWKRADVLRKPNSFFDLL